MEFTGIVLFTVSDKGDLVDLRFDFLVEQSTTHLALYYFDNDSSGADQAFADAAVRARVQKIKPKMKINIIGERPSSPLSERTEKNFNKLAQMKGDKATAKISKFVPDTGGFTVTVENLKSKNVHEVPFDGDPGKLANKSFHGRLRLIAHSKERDADIPELIKHILDIKP